MFGPDDQRNRSLGLRQYVKLSKYLGDTVKPIVKSANDVSATLSYDTLIKDLNQEVAKARESKQLPEKLPEAGASIANSSSKRVTLALLEPGTNTGGYRSVVIGPNGRVYLRYADQLLIASYRGTVPYWSPATPLTPGEYRLVDDKKGDKGETTWKLEVAPPKPEGATEAKKEEKTEEKKEEKTEPKKEEKAEEKKEEKADEKKEEKKEEKGDEKKTGSILQLRSNPGLVGVPGFLAHAWFAQAGAAGTQLSAAFAGFLDPPKGYDAAKAEVMSDETWQGLVTSYDDLYKKVTDTKKQPSNSDVGQALDVSRTLYSYSFSTTSSAKGHDRVHNLPYFKAFQTQLNKNLALARAKSAKVKDELLDEQVQAAEATLQLSSKIPDEPVETDTTSTPGLGKLQSQNTLLFRAVNHLRRGLTQKYSRWQKSNDFYYAHFRFKYADNDEESYNYAVYFPEKDASHIYYFSAQPVCVYWARFNIDEGPDSAQAWQWLPADQQTKTSLGVMPTGTFGTPTAMPMIPGRKQDSKSDRLLWPTLADLPVDARKWDVAAQPFDMDAVDQAEFDTLFAPAAPAAAPAAPELDVLPAVEEVAPPLPPA